MWKLWPPFKISHYATAYAVASCNSTKLASKQTDTTNFTDTVHCNLYVNRFHVEKISDGLTNQSTKRQAKYCS